MDQLVTALVAGLAGSGITALDSLKLFISEPTAKNLAECALSMRRDLGRKPLDLKCMDLKLSPDQESKPTLLRQ